MHSHRTLLPTPACPALSSYVASWRGTIRACALLVAVVTAMAALLLLSFSEVVPFIPALIIVLYNTYVAFCHVRDDNSTDFETRLHF